MVEPVTIRDAYPLPLIDDLLDRAQGAQFYSLLDLQSGYWQVRMAKKDLDKTAFITHQGLFQFKVMPFKLTNAPPTFQRLMNTVLRDFLRKCVAVFVDDVCVYSKTWEQHLLDLQAVFEALQNAGLRLNLKKCHFCRPEVAFLGFIVSAEGTKSDPAKVQDMIQFPRPKDLHGVRSFLGTLSYYRRFIQDFSKKAQPLHLLTKKKIAFHWGPRQEKAFQELKNEMTKAPILITPDLSKPFTLHTDASYLGFGAVLGQKDDQGREHVIAYASRSLKREELNYQVTELECAGLVWAVDHFHHYLSGSTFNLYTDHRALTWLFKNRARKRKFERWILQLQEYDYNIHYQKGKDNRADFLFRPSA